VKAVALESPTISDISRFAKKYTKTESGCWEWTAHIDSNGYGRFGLRSASRLAHRVSYLIHNGFIDAELFLDHLCRNRKCINPKHLEQVTNRENVARGTAWDWFSSKTHCPQKHEYSAENTYIYSDGRRACRTCDKLKHRARKARKMEV
jgi:hypothetical protein